MSTFKKRYENCGQIGKGSFGEVFLLRDLRTNRKVAMKKIDVELLDDKQKDNIFMEFQLLQKLMHPNIIQVCGCRWNMKSKEIRIYMEYCSGGDLRKCIKERFATNVPFEEKTILGYLHQVLQGLNYLHEHLVIHRDLKPENIFLAKKGVIKIADFGASAALKNEDEIRRTLNSTNTYAAPEALKEEGYSFKYDVWSLGSIAYELAVGQSPFHHESVLTVFRKIAAGDYTLLPDSPWSNSFRAMVYSMLTVDVTKRPDSKSLLQLDLFEELPLTSLTTEHRRTKSKKEKKGERKSEKKQSLAAFICKDGMNDESSQFFVYDSKEEDWQQMPANLSEEGRLLTWPAACVAQINGNSICVFDSAWGQVLMGLNLTGNEWWTQMMPNRNETGECAVVRDDIIYFVGGYDSISGKSVANVSKFDLHTQAWTQVNPLPKAACYPGVVFHNNHLTVIGGRTQDESRLTCVQWLDDDGQWQVVNNVLKHGDSSMTACSHGNDTYVCLRTGICKLLGEDKSLRLEHVGDSPGRTNSMISMGDKLYMVYTDKVFAFDPSDSILMRLPNLPLESELARSFVFTLEQ